MIALHPTSIALSLLTEELDSWSQPETDTAYRLHAEAKCPVIDVPGPAQTPMAQVITLVSRLRSPSTQMQRQAHQMAA